MNYAEIKYYDIANGPGVRTSLFVSGCRRHCRNCFNACTWDFDYGKPFTKEVQDEVLASLDSDYIDGLTILGGEPFEPENQRALLPFVKRVKAQYPDKPLWVFSGNVLEEMTEGLDGGEGAEHLPAGHARCEVTDELLSCIDVLVDGPFIEEQKDISLQFRGSRNQRILDVKESLRARKAVAYSIGMK